MFLRFNFNCADNDLENRFDQKELWITCNGSQANVTTSSSVAYFTILVANCMQPDGTCSKREVSYTSSFFPQPL